MKLVLESSGILKNRVIEGTALTPSVSLNGNIYSAEEIDDSQGLEIPLDADWEHTDESVGTVTYSLDEKNHFINYRIIMNSDRASEIQEGIHKVSIEAKVEEVIQQCSRKRCYNLLSGITLEGIGITKTPGVTQTTMNIVESHQDWDPITEHCHDCEKKKAPDIDSRMATLEKQLHDMTHCSTCGGLNTSLSKTGTPTNQ